MDTRQYCWRCRLDVPPLTAHKEGPVDEEPGSPVIEFDRFTCLLCGGHIGDSPPHLVGESPLAQAS